MEIVKKAFDKNNVAICFSADDKYASILAVTLASIAENSSPNNNYDIVVITSQMNDENQIKLNSVVAGKPNFSLRFISALPFVSGYNFYTESELTNTKYTHEIYFRVLAPAIFCEYEKVVYLDADLVIRTDIAELFDTDMTGYLLAGVRDYEGIAMCHLNNYERMRYRINELGIKNFNDYIISGVLVMNIAEFNKQFSLKQLLDLAVSKNWKQYDQDLLNYLCQTKIKIVDAAWDYVEDIYNIFKSLPPELLSEYTESEKDPKIVHFSASRKPWIKTDSKFCAEFWHYAKLTPYYFSLQKLLDNI